MKNEKHNGWTNYATWRVNLEIFDEMDCTDIPMFSRDSEPDISEVADYLRDYVEEILCQDCDPSRLAHSYAMAFISDVNWYEIASHFTKTWKDIVAEELQDE